MKTYELSKLGVEELKIKLSELKQEFAKEFVKTKVGSKTEKIKNLRNIKKDIARIQTFIRQKDSK